MGVHVGSAYYFYYEKQAVTTLNREFLHTVKTKADAYVIYADLCTLSEAELEKYHITFKKIPAILRSCKEVMVMELNNYQKQVMCDLSAYLTASTVEPICFPRGGNTGFPRMWPLASAEYRPIITLLNVRPMFA